MPPPLAHALTPGFNVATRYLRWKARVRQIATATYAPYAPLWAILAGASIRDIATRSGLKYDKTSAYLRGITEPPFYAGMKLARAIGCTAEALDAYLAAVQRAPLKIRDTEAQFEAADVAVSWKAEMAQGELTPAPPIPPKDAR